MKHLLTLCLIPALCLIQLVAPPQERQYTITVPAHLANPLWLLINGQRGKVSVEQFQELLPIVGNQFDSQDRQYAIEDSVMAANARKNVAHPDTTQRKKP